MTKKQLWGLAVLVLLIASLGCNLPSMVNTPEPTLAVSTEAVGDLERNVQQAMQDAAQTGIFSLDITESQLTSALALTLQKESDLPVSNLEARLQEGMVVIDGKASQNGMELPVKITLSVSVIACKTQLAVESASVGPLPLPKEQLNTLIPLAEQSLNDLIASSSVPNLCLTSVVIADGKMSVSGTANQ